MTAPKNNMTRLEAIVARLHDAERVDIEEWGDHPSFRVRGTNFVFCDADARHLSVKLSHEEAEATPSSEMKKFDTTLPIIVLLVPAARRGGPDPVRTRLRLPSFFELIGPHPTLEIWIQLRPLHGWAGMRSLKSLTVASWSTRGRGLIAQRLNVERTMEYGDEQAGLVTQRARGTWSPPRGSGSRRPDR
jgi:hypothetical protein